MPTYIKGRTKYDKQWNRQVRHMNAGRVKCPEGIFWKSAKSRGALPHFVRTLRQSKPFMLLPCTCIAIMTRRIFRKRSHKSSCPLDEAENRLKSPRHPRSANWGVGCRNGRAWTAEQRRVSLIRCLFVWFALFIRKRNYSLVFWFALVLRD
jgi:adenosyl cobinamide kinase/adenosyl cobinamide phosphate guanylyltransferase